MTEQRQPDLPDSSEGQITPTDTMKWAGWIGGLVFIGLVLLLAIKVPNPTGFQEFAFRVPMSIGAASFCAFVPGFLVVQALTSSERRQAGICGGGAIVVFLLLMYVNPTRIGGPAANMFGLASRGTSGEQPEADGGLVADTTPSDDSGTGGSAQEDNAVDAHELFSGWVRESEQIGVDRPDVQVKVWRLHETDFYDRDVPATVFEGAAGATIGVIVEGKEVDLDLQIAQSKSFLAGDARYELTLNELDFKASAAHLTMSPAED